MSSSVCDVFLDEQLKTEAKSPVAAGHVIGIGVWGALLEKCPP